MGKECLLWVVKSGDLTLEVEGPAIVPPWPQADLLLPARSCRSAKRRISVGENSFATSWKQTLPSTAQQAAVAPEVDPTMRKASISATPGIRQFKRLR